MAIREIGLALWLINSELTTPGAEEIFAYAGTTDLAVARAKIFAKLQELKLEAVYEKIEKPLIPILEAARERGILIDTKLLAELAKTYRHKLEAVSQKIFALVGHEFNLNSPKQLGEVLFTELKISLKGLRKTAGGAQSTRESELAKLVDVHPIIALILEHREWQKLLSTYLDNLPDLLDADNRLHTTLNQAGTTTGRMSSTNPNLQNIPARGESGPEIRNIFMASKGFTFLALDYSQIEMRGLAIMSGDQELLKIFQSGADIHTSVASRVFGVTPDQVTKDMRRQAKVINFGIIYGMGVNALRRNLG
ncbi:MAG: DNA polymerase, partial [Patescibacteria group bacterium]